MNVVAEQLLKRLFIVSDVKIVPALLSEDAVQSWAFSEELPIGKL